LPSGKSENDRPEHKTVAASKHHRAKAPDKADKEKEQEKKKHPEKEKVATPKKQPGGKLLGKLALSASPKKKKGATPEKDTRKRTVYEYTCKTCANKFTGVSSQRCQQHKLLVKDSGVKFCTDPQITSEDLTLLIANKVDQAKGFKERLDSHITIGYITKKQPELDEVREHGGAAITPDRMHELQRKQIRGAISKGNFAVNAELNDEFLEWVAEIAPDYVPPTKRQIEAARDELHDERIRSRNDTIKQMGRGGIVTDGCKGKLVESLINFIFVEGLSGLPLYWKTIDMESTSETGINLATEILKVAGEMNEAAGATKVRYLTTDRTRANKISWQEVEKAGIEGVPDSVHMHHSCVDDIYKAFPLLKANFLEAYAAVKFFRNHAKLLADFKKFQEEQGKKPLVFIKARFERLASKYFQARRLLRLKSLLRTYVHKKRYKVLFEKKDRPMRHQIATTFKNKLFWKRTRRSVKILAPIVRSMRLCDQRLTGKAGLVYPSIYMMQEAVVKRLQKHIPKDMPGKDGKEAVEKASGKIAERIAEIDNEKLKAAAAAHPVDVLAVREEASGPVRSVPVAFVCVYVFLRPS